MSKILTNPAGNIRLELRDDRLSAWATILDKNLLSDEQDILNLIDEAGIKNGFEEALKYMRRHGLEKEYNTPFPVAMCNRIQGEAKLGYYFDLDQAGNFDGRVTPGDLDKLTAVEAGTVLADYNSNIFERDGSIYNIYGEMLPDDGFDPEAVPQIQGDNVSFDGEKRQFIAECAGFPRVEPSGRISLLDRLTINGDVKNPATPLRSPVALEITGSVEFASLAAAGDIIIRGDLRNSEVYCQGDLLVEGDILSCRQPGLEVLGNIRCSTLLSSKVLCRGKILFERSFLNCDVACDGGIRSDSGALSGGHIECYGNVVLGRLGDPLGTHTELEITISPYHKAQLTQLTRELIHLKQDLTGNAATIETLTDKIRICETELDQELNAYLKRPPDEKLKILVEYEVFPPVQIRILKHEYKIKNQQTHLEIIEKD